MPAQQRAASFADRTEQKNAPTEFRRGLTKSHNAPLTYAAQRGSTSPRRPDPSKGFRIPSGTHTTKLVGSPDHQRVTRGPDGLAAAGLASSCPLSQEETVSAHR